MSSGFATMISVGPGEKESLRLQEVVTSLFQLENECRELVLIDDGMACSHQQVQGWVPKNCLLTILKNPRNGVGDGWADGIGVGLFAGLKHLSERDDISFVLRVDADSAVFDRFSDRIAAIFREQPECGLIGTYRKFPNGEERTKPGFMIERLVAPYLLSRFLARLILDTWKPMLVLTALRRRSVILAAVRRGYRKGEFVQGGGHAFSVAALRAAAVRHLLDDPFLFFHTRIVDDVVLTIICYAAGFVALDYNSPGEVFAVINTGLPDAPDVLINNGYAIAHSIKADPVWAESDIREIFSAHRRQVLARGFVQN